MEITYDKREGGMRIEVNGRMDAITASTFEDACGKVIDEGEKMLVVDCTLLEYISSAGLRSILIAAKKLKAAGGTMCFCGLSGMVEEVFQVSGMGSMFSVTTTADEAFHS